MRFQLPVDAGRFALRGAMLLAPCAMSLLLGGSALADEPTGTAGSREPVAARSLRIRIGELTDNQPLFTDRYSVRSLGAHCQVPLPPIGAVSPFPIALRLGAMVSPRLKFDGGIDATIRGLHLFPGFTSRVDADAIISANFGGITTLVPVTFDQIYNLNLPVGTRVYLGGGIGPYFGDRTRFGGKLIAGAEFNRIGVEGNIHFSGSGEPLYTVQARLGL